MQEYYKCEKCAIGDVFFWHKKKKINANNIFNVLK